MQEEHSGTYKNFLKGFVITISVILIVLLVAVIIKSTLSALGLNSAVGDIKTCELTESFTDLEMDISAAEIRIVSGDAISVKTNLKDYFVEASGGVLKIEDKNKIFKDYKDAYVEIVLPSDFIFKTAKIKAGAGEVNIERLAAQELEINLGAGRITINELVVTESADINGGAGDLNINNGSLSNLDLDMGAGRCKIRSRMLGECDLDMGIGEADLIFVGQNADYKIDITVGLGGVRLNGEKFKNGTVGNGPCSVKIEGGLGSLDVNIQAE